MTDKVNFFKAGSRGIGFKQGQQAVDLIKAFGEHGLDLSGENEK